MLQEIRLDLKSKKELVERLQEYMADDLKIEIGGCDAEFMLDFFAEHIGGFY